MTFDTFAVKSRCYRIMIIGNHGESLGCTTDENDSAVDLFH